MKTTKTLILDIEFSQAEIEKILQEHLKNTNEEVKKLDEDEFSFAFEIIQDAEKPNKLKELISIVSIKKSKEL